MKDGRKESNIRKVYSILKQPLSILLPIKINKKNHLFIIIFILLNCLILYNIILLSNDIINGDFTAKNLFPSPRYEFMRVPENPLTLKVKAENRLAADFAQIYFPSQKFSSLTQAYTRESLDPWQRPSRYAPLIHAICSMSICKLNYGYASFLHITIQLFMFYLSFIYAFKILHLERYIFYSILLVNFCLFLTPAGLSWFERGQFSLYVSISYLWLMLGIINRSKLYIFLSALFAYVKLTSLPLIFVVFFIWMLNSKNLKELKQSIFTALVFLLTIALLFLLYPELGVDFISGIFEQELGYNPGGISLSNLLPKYLVKALPIILIILGYSHIKRYKNDFIFLVPYLTGCAIILITYPTLAYDYSVPCLFCFIPLVIYWSKQTLIHDNFAIHMIKYFFPFFIIAASFSKFFIMFFYSQSIITIFYILSSLVFFVLPVLPKMHRIKIKDIQ